MATITNSEIKQLGKHYGFDITTEEADKVRYVLSTGTLEKSVQSEILFSYFKSLLHRELDGVLFGKKPDDDTNNPAQGIVS